MCSLQQGGDSRSLRCIRKLVILTAVLSLLSSTSATAVSLGMVADNAVDRIAIFDADTDVVTSNFAPVPGDAVGDCAVSSDERLGFTTNSSSEIFIIDLKAGQSAASTRSGVSISNLGVDMSLSPDNAYLVLAGGGALAQPLSVIDTRQRAEISTTSPFTDHTSVEFCDDGTLLITTTHGELFSAKPDNALYDASLGADGQVSLMGSRISSGAQPNNSACAPGSRAGVMLDRSGGLTSFTLPGLELADFEAMHAEYGVAAVFNRAGTRLYVRTSNTVEAYAFDPLTGEMQRDWTRKMPPSSTYYGMDQIAMHPQGGKLYVDGGDAMLILDPGSGIEAGSISTGDATGICFARAPVQTDQPLTGRQLTITAAPPP